MKHITFVKEIPSEYTQLKAEKNGLFTIARMIFQFQNGELFKYNERNVENEETAHKRCFMIFSSSAAQEARQITVYAVAHDWEYRDDEKEHSDIGAEIIAVRLSDVEAMACRDKCASKIMQARRAESFRTELLEDSSGNTVIFSQPYEKWYLKSYKDRLLIEELQLPVSAEQLDELFNIVKAEQ